MTTAEFIQEHLQDDVRALAFQKSRYPEVDFSSALEQIQGYQTALKKLPSWTAVAGVVYPPHLNMEQCSSEPTALYKLSIISRLMQKRAQDATKTGELAQEKSSKATTMVDLTGGFGVDFSFMSRNFQHAVYVERNESLCTIARKNFPLLGMTNTEVCCAEAVDYLENMRPVDLIFMDPARRDS